MKYTAIIFLIICIVIFASYYTIKKSNSLDEMNPEELKKEIINTGSRYSYNLLSMYYDDKKMDEDFLDLSIMMYEKHHYNNALSNIYDAFIYKYNPTIPFYNGNKAELFKNVPKKEQELALKYLEIGVTKGDYSCIERLSDYYLSIGNMEESKKILKIQDELIESHKKKVNDSLSKIKIEK